MHGVAAYGVVKASALLAIELLRIPDENHPNAGFSFHLVPRGGLVALCVLPREHDGSTSGTGPWVSTNASRPNSLMQHRQSCGCALALTFRPPRVGQT